MIPTSYAIFSCETAINDIVHEWKIAMDGKKSILAVFLDLQKAFETIDPFILLKKLDKLGFEDSTLNWFKNYLTGRTQMVKIDNYMSKKMKVKLGVPQGSILGPLLFYIYKMVVHVCMYCIRFYTVTPITLKIYMNQDICSESMNTGFIFCFHDSIK